MLFIFHNQMRSHGKVPMFKMRPHKGWLIASIVVLALGGLCFHNGHLDPGDLPAQDRAHLILMISIILAGLMVIIATGRMWFAHLWHDRYK